MSRADHRTTDADTERLTAHAARPQRGGREPYDRFEPATVGYYDAMSEHDERDEQQEPTERTVEQPTDGGDTVNGNDDAFERMVAERSELSIGERDAGSDAPTEQARAILEDSEQRALEREAAPMSAGERRTSDEATPR